MSTTTPSGRVAPVAGAAVFLLAFLAAGAAGGALSDRGLPLPDAPAADVAAYFGANPGAAVAGAAMQAVSVLGLAVFARGVARTRAQVGAAGLSVVAMLVSSALSVVLAIVASSASLGTVQAVRLGSFYSGGVVAVVSLGVFVLVAAKTPGFLGAPSRWFGFVAGALAVLSVLSLVFPAASVLLPVGRVLSMVWTVVVAIVFARRRQAVPA